MKALTLIQYNQFEYGNVEPPVAGENDVLIDVKACGICGSDVHGMDGSTGRRIPPVIMGHEAAGVIREVGSIARERGWKPGDRVTFDSTVYCGKCEACREGRINLCPDRRVLGVSCQDYRQHGAYADIVCVPQHVCYPLPDNLSFEHAAFAEPVSIALHAVSRVPAAAGKSAVVVGAGMIGLLVVQCLRLRGCNPIYVVDLDDRKIAKAKTMGAADGFSASDTDVLAKIRNATGGDGADIAMEVVGISPTLQLAVNCVRKGGAVGLVGNLAAEATLPLQAAVTRELTLFGSCSCAGEYPEALRCIADGSIQVEPLISVVVPLAEGAAWFDRLHKGEEELLKVILRPD
ncbi:MAG: galactitol-1-phosphate 5-dehydrogenase [Verrucomicrobiales bacterium]